ncbi:MAG: NAD(P)H-hydrate epimerase, partial [Actinomycetota bacterium]|nr:NAD(P)H-hydrate epimerase [Actinomycetota bacterium]
MTTDWLDPVFDGPGMAATDRWAIEDGVSSLTLMESAGRKLAETASRMSGNSPVAILCGKGNNGGDGLVAARHLLEAGHDARVFLLWPADELSPDSRTNLDRLPADAVAEIDGPPGPELLDGFSLVIDALLGTGFSGEPRDPVAAAIRSINVAPAQTLACDLPSGVDASTGEAGLSVRAEATVTFHALKVGHLVAPGKNRCGRVDVVDIGIPPGGPDAGFGAIGAAVLDLLPRRVPGSNKFSSG